MNLRLAWNRRSFLAALGLTSGSLLASSELEAASSFAKKHTSSSPPLDGSPIVPSPAASVPLAISTPS